MVILPPLRPVGPAGPAEHRQPVVRHRAVFLRIGPDVPVLFRACGVEAGLEPGMLVGGVAEHFVEDDFEAAIVRGLQQCLEIGKRAVVGVHAVIVADVVAPVAVGRGMDRRQPDRIDAEALNIVELGQQAGEIAMAVAVAVAETADIDLIDDGAAPPGDGHSFLPRCCGGGAERSEAEGVSTASIRPVVPPPPLQRGRKGVGDIALKPRSRGRRPSTPGRISRRLPRPSRNCARCP